MKKTIIPENLIDLIKNLPARIRRRSNRYWTPGEYNAKEYWRDRHSQYGFDLRGVGNKGLSSRENEHMYLEAKKVFLSLCQNHAIDFQNTLALDIGCGTGFYARVFLENGGKRYTGIDITDVLFDRLRQDFPQFEFLKLDVSIQAISAFFDLIIMIDVTQHITNNEKFSFAMQNVRSSLNKNGILIVTSWLNKDVRNSFYEISRGMDAYRKEFPDYEFSDPIPFRDKFIFSIRKKS